MYYKFSGFLVKFDLMHPYSVNTSTEKQTVLFILALISLGFAFLLNLVKGFCPWFPHWLPLPTAFAFYGLLYYLFDNYIWKYSFIKNIISTPDLNGSYDVVLKSSRDNYGKEYSGKLEIHQTWSKINIHLETKTANSYSKTAYIEIQNKKNFTLKWEYLSTKKPEYTSEDYMHYGVTRLNIDVENNILGKIEGDYYTDICNHVYGKISVK